MVIHVAVLLGLPFLLTGIINRVKAIWGGRKGPRLSQGCFDVLRLLRKQPVYSSVTTPVFKLAPWVILASTLVTGLFVPLLRDTAPLSMNWDVVAVLYLWGLGRVAMMLAALDTGSAFEGMGASREATFGALVEPAIFLAVGALLATSGHTRLAELVHVGVMAPGRVLAAVGALVALALALLVEASRVPVDDPNTHLELTMIHEVMILDHSGPDLAALQVASAMKMTLFAMLIAGILNPLPASVGPLAVAAVNVALTLVIAIAVGLVESLIARLRMVSVPQLIAASMVAATIAVLGTAWFAGGAR
ncbi:MAG: NADH-quinone oxidoreductase subunit H [Deltaproteobacteria bacterium]|nr:NADH-quinone oxidoreductase subunit H [Deltaproteobacteria bacterium]